MNQRHPVASRKRRASFDLQAFSKKTTTPDSKLLDLIAEYDEIENNINDLLVNGSSQIVDDVLRSIETIPLKEKQHALLDAICSMKAKTFAGLLARAKSLCLWDTEMSLIDSPDQYPNERMIAALLRDILSIDES